MSDRGELKYRVSTGTANFVLLAIATVGIYPLMWLYRYSPIIEEVTKRNFAGEVFVIWVAVCIGFGSALVGTGDPAVELVASLLSLASAVLYIVWAFKARTALRAYAQEEFDIDLRMNPLWTFLFTIYHINYCINDLALQAAQPLLSEPQETVEQGKIEL